jgi:undecaprenyl pyrophosphate synthase
MWPKHKSPEKNGTHTKLNIVLLNHDNGQRMLVDIAERLTDMRRRGSVPEDLTNEGMAGMLSEIYGPPPDLIIIFGPRFALEGFPAWYLKSPELQQVVSPEARKMRALSFCRCLI